MSYAGQRLTINWSVSTSAFTVVGARRTRAVTVPLIPPGTKVLDRWNQLNTGVRKIVRFGALAVHAQVDVYNVLNSSAVQRENQTFGPSLGRPSAILQPRMFRLATQLKFIPPRAGARP